MFSISIDIVIHCSIFFNLAHELLQELENNEKYDHEIIWDQISDKIARHEYTRESRVWHSLKMSLDFDMACPIFLALSLKHHTLCVI